MNRHALLWIGLALVVAVSGGLIVHKELVLHRGTTLRLELAPVDPRSLMQGDYMALDYRITRELRPEAESWPRDGRLVLQQDRQGVGSFVRLHRPDDVPVEGEVLLRYRKRRGRLRLGAESFFFQEGKAELFGEARFCELKVTASGSSVLVALLDKDLQRLGGRTTIL